MTAKSVVIAGEKTPSTADAVPSLNEEGFVCNDKGFDEGLRW